MKHKSILPSAMQTSHAPWMSAVVRLGLLVFLFASSTLSARPLHQDQSRRPDARRLAKTTDSFPVFETRLHAVGKVWWAITNYGLFGTEGGNVVPEKDRIPLKIDYSPSFEFPAGTNNEYLYAGGLWVGGIVGTDTLVSYPINGVSSSTAGEFVGYDTISESSSLRTSILFAPDAVAEQQFYSAYTDTQIVGGTDEFEGRPHLPLNIKVSQTSYAWSDFFSRQFVLVFCWIKNIGDRPIDKMAAGIFLDADVLNDKTSSEGYLDDLSGFRERGPDLNLPQFQNNLNVTWVADNDGDPQGGTFPLFSPRGAVGMRLLYSPPIEDFSFNWWLIGGSSAQEWGPTKQGSRAPQAGGGLGAPEGDRARYYVMTNGEIDYGQMLAAEDFTASGWRPPIKAGACGISDGLDTRQLTSLGPSCVSVYPGDSLPFVYAMIGGDKFHTDPKLVFDCSDPYAKLNSLGYTNSLGLDFYSYWASWIFDTPGYDTDDDGYKGEYHLSECDSTVNGIGYGCDTIYYTGDCGPPPGPPRSKCQTTGWWPPTAERHCWDLAGPAGPPCPFLGGEHVDGIGGTYSFETRPAEIIVRWTGRVSETERDPLSKKLDFEGYRLYTSAINSADQFSLVASWDREDYRVLTYDDEVNQWIQQGDPLSVDAVVATYGQGLLDSLRLGYYGQASLDVCRTEVVSLGDSVFTQCTYFPPQDDNRGNGYMENASEVSNTIQHLGDSVVFDSTLMREITFGYYEARLTNVNPSIGLFVSVSAFDYGNFKLGLPPLESVPGSLGCSDFAIPIYSAEVVEDSNLQVSVYPNPYKISYEGPNGQRTTYFDEGLEAREKRGRVEGLDESDRRIYFINLPSKATIRIYTLDGDLVRTIVHEDPSIPGSQAFLTDYSSRAAWDLVSRNTQAVVSGIYIYRVDSDVESYPFSQVGKIVIIK